jgi:hypothetical protein
LNQPSPDQQRRSAGPDLFSELRRVVDTAFAPARGGRQPTQQSAPSTPSALSGDPGDLVASALAILAEDAEAWRIRRNGNLAPRSER